MSYAAMIKEKKEKAAIVANEFHRAGVVQLNLGKKAHLPQDVMVEELALLSNKGAKMFHLRQKRVDKFTIESPDDRHQQKGCVSKLPEGLKENYKTEIFIPQGGKAPGPPVSAKLPGSLTAGKHLNMNPSLIAPGYSGPLKEIPPERFNSTVVPKSYHSPWAEAMNEEHDYVESISANLPEPPPQSQAFRCFNRVATPFGTPALFPARSFPPPAFELVEEMVEPVTMEAERIANRPNFNRRPRGWIPIIPESAEL
ncbi:myozenin-2 isoform X2 [Callorhinchus milii]|uniref:myozenin-2 isoform X2 n=1 Tax=Callorhinchus milii TaxID=7868 RepID=UPI0004571FC4|nr:myozenin-2 isoform X2 [Callorhinchus milii]|eukprot:gi/632979227/ref/XP_007906353.1/ PREDICTED: myozenin-3 isoform X2 [Callorhinchus milii]